jgi:hypothetical protein
MKWFGKAWNPNLCVPEEEMETPIGEKCPKCTSRIESGDQGLMILCATTINLEKDECEVVPEAWHLDCFLRNLLPPEFIKKHPRVVGSNPGKN